MGNTRDTSPHPPMLGLVVTTSFVAFFAIFMEWLFFATKPSFMSGMPFLEKLQVLMATAAPVVAASTLVVAVVMLPGTLARRTIVARPLWVLGRVFPSLILAGALFLMLDNFTLTVFGYGIRSAGSVVRWAYVLAGLALLGFSYRFVGARAQGLRTARFTRPAIYLAVGLVILSFALCIVEAARATSQLGGRSAEVSPSPASDRTWPNVLLIASDGLDATHMGAYGYYRNTTPAISGIVKESLVAENAFPNSAQTGASIASLLTGKLPTETHLIFPPDILRGRDSYEHLPGILARHGYRSIDLSVRNYADAYDLNMRGAFDWANGRSWNEFQLPGRVTDILGEGAYLMEQVADRLLSRVLHVTGVRSMPNPYEEVQAAATEELALERGWGKTALQGDLVRLNLLLRFIGSGSGPFFAHVQLFGTHGPAFPIPITKRVFSAGEDQDRVWMQDFYDDAILRFDTHFGTILEFLRARGMLENTLIILHTDHGQQWQTGVRVPLVLRFPRGAHAGRIRDNVQNIDIAPTVLDYLGIPIPDWMSGHSLLSPRRDPLQPLLCPRMYVALEMKQFRAGADWESTPPRKPPFFRIEVVTVVICHKAYRFHLETNRVDSSDVPLHTAPCSQEHEWTEDQIRNLVVEHLRANGYDTSSLTPP